MNLLQNVKKGKLSCENLERKNKVIEHFAESMFISKSRLQYYEWNANYMILKLLLAGQNPTRVKILRNRVLLTFLWEANTGC